MFWQFESGVVSQIDSLLDKENVTLKELMEEEDILQECKSQNQKLIEFLTRRSVLEEMIDLITKEPPEDSNERLRYKYANIASEIMTSDVNAICDALVADDSLLTKLYQFIDTDQELNPLLSSFFSKLLGLLFVKKTEFVFEFFKTKDLLSLLVSHIETSAIMDLILKLVISVDNQELRKVIINWLFENDLIGKLLNIFKEQDSSQRQSNAAHLICDIIKVTREHMSLLQDKVDSDPLLDALESTETVNRLLENMFFSRTESALVNGLSILQSLLEYKRHCINNNIQNVSVPQNPIQQSSEFEAMPQCYAPQNINTNEMISCEQTTSLDNERLNKCVKQVQEAILPRLADFSSLLEDPPHQQPILTTIGLIEKPLGVTRLEVAHLFTALISSNNIQINDRLAEMKTLPLLIDLFFEYPWNNFLHKHIEQIVGCILNTNNNNSNITLNNENNISEQTVSSEDNCSPLVIKLLTDCRLIDRIISAFDSNEDQSANDKQVHRPGYMGHLVIIGNMIKDKCQDSLIKRYLTEELFDKWKGFVDNVLTPINKTICSPLVNEMPQSLTMDDSSLRNQESALQQAFIEYQMQQMTRNLCTQIAFAANEFNEVNDNIPNQLNSLSRVNFNFENQLQHKDKSLEFEKICSEKLKASLDSNSSDEEDLWEDRDMTFSQSVQSEHKKSISLIGDESAVFSEDSFAFNSSQNNRLTSMEVDSSDPWSTESANSSSMAPIPMDTMNPWEGFGAKTSPQPTNSGNSLEADSWADFTNFATFDFNSSSMSTGEMSSASCAVTSSSATTLTSFSQNVAESTTVSESSLTSQVDSSSSTANSEKSQSIGTNESNASNMAAIDVREQDNVVTSSCDSLKNGPNS